MKNFFIILLLLLTGRANAQVVDFCGELAPMERDFVSYRLMDVIKWHLRNKNFLPVLKAKSEMYFPLIVPILQQYHIPEDFKYLPVVESGFTNATSVVGAQGIWQLMPATAAELGLDVHYSNDERNHLLKATHAACRYIRQLYGQLKSWTLAAAAYNAGAGNISRNIKKQGSNDYYQLLLNNETAQYIYKILAVKQLFESPELYLPGFGYNVFNKRSEAGSVFSTAPKPDTGAQFKTLRIDVGKRAQRAAALRTSCAARVQHTGAFKDGELVNILLLDDLQTSGVYIRRNTRLSGRGWLVSNRIYVDLGVGALCDQAGKKGIAPEALQNGGAVQLVINN